MSITGSIIAIILFVLRPLVRNRLPKSMQYYLWFIVLVTLVVPLSKLVVLPNSISDVPTISKTVDWYVVTNDDIFERIKPYETVDADGFIGIPEYSMAEVDALVPDAWVPEAVDWFRIIYYLGVTFYLMFICCSYAIFTDKLKRRNTTQTSNDSAMLAELCGNQCVPLLYRNPLATTPMLIGMFRPTIILPDRCYTNEQLRAVLLHEITHLRRKDVLVKWLSVFVTALHWFNPIVWLVRREIDRACELSCDEAVIRNLDTEGKQNYGETLLYVAVDAKTPYTILSTTMCEEKKALKERLGAIMKSRKHTRLTIIVSAMLLVVVGVVAITLGAGSKITSRSNYNFDTFIVNAYKINGYMDDEAIRKLTLTEPLDSQSGYGYNFEEIRFDLDYDRCITRFQLNVYDTGIFDMWFQYSDVHPDKRDGNNGLAFLGDGDEILRQIGQVEALVGDGKKGWYDREQGLRYERYTADNGNGEVTFVYSDRESDGILNRLIWVIAERKLPDTKKMVDGYDLAILSEMKMPYVGDNSSVGDILYCLPTPDSRLKQQFFSIGDDYGTSFAPNTLTIYYEPHSEDVENTTMQYLAHENAYLKNAVLLFALIDNLDEVTFAVRDDLTSDAILHKEAYTSYQRLSRYEATLLVEMNIADMWNGNLLSIDAAFSKIDEKHNPTPSTQETGRPATWQQIYLGMPSAAVYDLFGAPDYQASGLMWFGYNDIGVFDPGTSNSGVIEKISLNDGTLWSVYDLIRTAVIQHNESAFYTSAEVYPTESHVILALDASPNGFTAYVMSLFLTFLPEGEYNVREVAGHHTPLALTFTKNQSGDYTLTDYWQAEDGNRYMPSIRSKFPENTWDLIDTQLYIQSSNQSCYDEAMYHFVGAIPYDSRYSIGVGTAAVTNVAGDTNDDEYFVVSYFPEATLRIEEYGAEWSSYKSQSWIIEYADKSENITVGKNGTNTIPITDDLIGIYNVDETRYVMKFEKYTKAE